MGGLSGEPTGAKKQQTPVFWYVPHPFSGSAESAFTPAQPVQATATPFGVQTQPKRSGQPAYGGSPSFPAGDSQYSDYGDTGGPPKTAEGKINLGGVGDWALNNLATQAGGYLGTALGGLPGGIAGGLAFGLPADRYLASQAQDLYQNAGLDYNRPWLDSILHSLPFGGIFTNDVPTSREVNANINTMNLRPEDFGPVTPPGWTPPSDTGTPATDLYTPDFSGVYDPQYNNPGLFRTGGAVPMNHDGVLSPVPATLHEGEFVLRPEAVRKYGIGLLSALNAGKIPSRKAAGLLRL